MSLTQDTNNGKLLNRET